MTHLLRRLAPLAAALLWAAAPAVAQEDLALSDVLAQTHVHGLAEGAEGLLLATHHGLWSVDPASDRARRVGQSRDDFMGFSAHPEDPRRVFASGHPAGGGNLGVIGSTDGGETWTQLSPGVGGPVDFHQMAISGADPDRLYGIHHGTSLQRSDDAGRSWREVGAAPEGVIDIAASGAAADRLFAATRSGLLRSDDAGQSWTRAHPATAPVSLVEVMPGGGILAYVLGEGLLRASEDGAEDWERLHPGFGEDYPLHLIRIGEDPGRLVAATASNVLLASPDGGRSWEVLARPR